MILLLELLIIFSLYCAVQYLDPRFKNAYCRDPSLFRTRAYNYIISCVMPTNPETGPLCFDDELIEDLPTSPKKQKTEGGFFAKRAILHDKVTRKNSGPKTVDEKLENELKKYSQISTLELNADPLSFWNENQHNFPILSNLAEKCFSAPATSVSSEQIFSIANDVFDYRRSRLSAKLAEQIIFLNQALPHVNFRY